MARSSTAKPTYLPSDPLKHPLHELLGPIENLGRRALRNPRSRQLLQVSRFLRRRVDRDLGK
jgi:hypothetical protein